MKRLRGRVESSTAGWAYADLLLALCLVFLGSGAVMATDSDSVTRVIDVNSRTPDGTYGLGSRIDIIVTINNPVTVDGRLWLEMDVGLQDSLADFSRQVSETQLEFIYVVEDKAITDDLNYLTPLSLKSDGGGIRDEVNDRAVGQLVLPTKGAVGSLSANRNIQIDGTLAPGDRDSECEGQVEREPTEFSVEWTASEGISRLVALIAEQLGDQSNRSIGVMLLFGGARDISEERARDNAREAAEELITSGWPQARRMYFKAFFDRSKLSSELQLSIFLERTC